MANAENRIGRLIVNRLRRLLAAIASAYMATFAGSHQLKPTYKLYLFSPDGKATRRRQLRSVELERRKARFV